ncbi:MAG: FxsA family protein [Aestuariivirga sp.]|uniref:FxsA family protein n=1 Tax=Aestuariivirga sp. TaxID=2650926 RepID=UPI0025BF898A|nr:FxsA family protein [Aestuariivirga sp.]MCA3561334.1 FxsA family protein [Aestuariivirga sp.]
MIRTLPLLVLAAAAAEITSIIWVGSLIGVVPTLLLMLLGGVVGVRLIASAGMSVAAALRSPVQSGSPLNGLGGKAAARTASGVLFLLPGFFSDAVALLLFLAPVRRWIGSWFRIETYTVGSADNRGFDRVIEAEAIEISSEIEPPDRTLR